MNSILSRVLLHRFCKVASQAQFLYMLTATLIPRLDAWDISAQLWVYFLDQFCCPKVFPELGILLDPILRWLQDSAEAVDYLITEGNFTPFMKSICFCHFCFQPDEHLLPDGPSCPPCHIILWSQIFTTESPLIRFSPSQMKLADEGSFSVS